MKTAKKLKDVNDISMADKCILKPRVKNKEGKLVSSKLFDELTTYFKGNREFAWNIYAFYIEQEDGWESTYDKWYVDKNAEDPLTFPMDENNQPTVKGLLNYINFEDTIGSPSEVSERRTLEYLNKKAGHFKKGSYSQAADFPDTSVNREKLITMAQEFNKSEWGSQYRAVVTPTTSPGYRAININVVKRGTEKERLYANSSYFSLGTEDSISLDEKQMDYVQRLNGIIKKILDANGVSVGVLNELEEKLRANGVTDFEMLNQVTSGFIELIRLAKGKRGELALPEEFAHVCVKALADNPIIKRAFNYLLENEQIVKEILGDEFENYQQTYQDRQQMAEEALGKLLAKHFLNEEEMTKKPYRNILQRVIDAIKKFFSRFNENDFHQARYDADQELGELARQILTNQVQLKVKDIKLSKQINNKLYSLGQSIAADIKGLEEIKEVERKRLKVYQSRTINPEFTEKQQDFIAELNRSLEKKEAVLGIEKAMSHIVKTAKDLNELLNNLRDNTTVSMGEKASKLRDTRNYLKSYEHILEVVDGLIYSEDNLADPRYSEEFLKTKAELQELVKQISIRYKNIALPQFIEFFKQVAGNVPLIYRGKTYTVEELVTVAMEDITFFDRWLDSMADSSHPLLNLFDKALKQKREEARLDTIRFVNERIKLAGNKLMQAGITDMEWMFAVNKEGKRTGSYVTPWDWDAFLEEKAKAYAEIDSHKYTLQESRRLKREWFKEHIIEDEDAGEVPNPALFPNKQYQQIANNPAKLEFYNTMIECKKELDSYLPPNVTSLYSTIKIRKDLVERVKSSDRKVSQVWEGIKDQFLRRSDDEDFDTSYSIKDLEGREVQVLPIYYTKLKDDESEEDVSTDVVSTMAAYAAMAIDYNKMNDIIDILENGRDMMQDNFKSAMTRGEKFVSERFRILGEESVSDITKQTSRVIERLNDFFQMQVYKRYMDDEGTLFGTDVDKAKGANTLNRITSLNTMALNPLLGISNVATGRVMMRIESMCKQFFNERDTITADAIYAKELFGVVSEIGSATKESKLNLFDELFNIGQDYDQDIRDIEFDRQGNIKRLVRLDTLFFMTKCGEHWMQNRTALALANSYKMLDADGNTISLWDAFEVVPIDESNPSLGNKLALKEGVTKEDGSEFTDEDISKFSLKCADINHNLHGIYNSADKSAIQKLSLGRMAIMFRKWIPISVDRRFASGRYNLMTDEFYEGYYRTTGRFLLNLIKDIKASEFDVASRWDELNDTQKANVKRAMVEVAHFIAIAIAMMLIGKAGDDDDNKYKDTWAFKTLNYEIRRLYTEIGVMIPGPQQFNEALTIVKSPAAAINTMQGLASTLGVLNPFNYEMFGGKDAIVTSGRFKGHNKAYRALMKSPIIPMSNTINKALDPGTAAQYFNQK